MSKSKIFIGISISFATGIFLASWQEIPKVFTLYILAAATILFAVTVLSKAPRFVPLAALFLFCAGFGAWRLDISKQPNEFQNQFGQKQKLEGYIVEDIDIRTDKQLITFRPKQNQQNILITTTKTGDYFYGDWVVAEGKVAEPKSFEDFDYPKYLERYDVYALLRYPKFLVLKSHLGNPLKENLLRIKYAFIRRIGRIIPEPKSSLLLGILIGARKTLPQNVSDNFTVDGLSHVVAVSGYNISIIIGSLGGLLAKMFGRKASFWLSLVVIIGFVIIAGASASVIRAALMGVLLLLSFNIGRLYSITPSLFFAALVMLVINPKILYWDAGFQLSFLATMGIVYFVPLLEQLTLAWPNPWNIKGTLFTTMSAIVATLPLILFAFGRLSVVAPAANLVVLPAVPATMLFGFLTFLPVVGPGFGLVADLLLAYILKITEIFARLPYASVNIKISELMLAMLYAIIILVFVWLKHLSKKVEEVRIL
jgi:competence protein ComEC